MDFETAYAKYRPEIKRIAPTQRVPGMDADDVASEMQVCLWRACQSYRPDRGTFGTYWWSLWMNRRSDIADEFYAGKRAVLVLAEELMTEGTTTMRSFPEPPLGSSPQERLVWSLLGHGSTGTEAMGTANLTKRRYYDIIRKWRTDEVREELMG